MRILDLALKDLKQITRNRQALLFLLIMPLVFTLVFGLAFGGFEAAGEGSDDRLPVGLVDRDQGRFSQLLQKVLDDSAVIRLEEGEWTADELAEVVNDGELAGGLVIEAGFNGSNMAETVIILADPGSTGSQSAQREMQGLIGRLQVILASAEQSVQARERRQPFDNSAEMQAYFDQAVDELLLAWETPPIRTSSAAANIENEDEATLAESSNAFTQSAPGMMLQFAIAGLIGAAEILVTERKSRTLQRLLTTAMSRAEILAGHYLAMFVLIFTQLMVLILFGALFLQLDYFSAPLATLLVAAATALFSASLGLLIGALARTPEQVAIFALIPMFLLAGFGGAWVSLEFTGESFQTIGHLSPVAWAMDGFQNIIIRGLGLSSVLLPVGVILAYAAVVFGLAVWRFRFE